jgi:thioredoxin-related protein
MMKQTYSLILLASIYLTACTSDPYQGLYEGIKNQNDLKKSPQEREMNPAPSYDAYKKERDSQSGQ